MMTQTTLLMTTSTSTTMTTDLARTDPSAVPVVTEPVNAEPVLTEPGNAEPAVRQPLQEAPEVLAAVAESVGMTLLAARRFSLEATARGYVAGYELELRSPAVADETHTVYLESNPSSRDRPGVLSFHDEDSGDRVSAWLYPNDPELPALAAAVFPQAATVLLGRLGLQASTLQVSIAAYRPGKRAVVRLTAPEFTVYLKVVRPAVAGVLHARHEAWPAHGVPAPRSLGWSGDGFIALESLTGVEAGQVLATLPPTGFLDALDALTSTIGTLPGSAPARASLVTRLPWYLDRLRALLPGHAAQITVVGAAIARRRDAAPAATPVTVHGDLHVGQIFVAPEQPTHIVGVLDIDTAGLGDPADDAAALYAHLLVTALHLDDHGDAPAAAQARRLAGAAGDRWPRVANGPGFDDRARAIAATHLLGHILGLTGHAAALLAAAADLLPTPRA